MEKRYATPAFVTSEDIKRVRKKVNMTQKEFAELIGVSKPTVERWEAGDGKITGAVTFAVQSLDMHPEYVSELIVPEKELPLRLKYYFDSLLCTIIDVDEVNRKVSIKNYTDNLIFRAFGCNEKPTYDDYSEFLESRCFPRERDKMKLTLAEFGIPFYDPMLIIEKTEGRMAEDRFRIEIERL